jgi:superfamily II DNA or RNA helicase
MPLTTEQQEIIDHVKNGHHVSVDALPGSGKSRVAYEMIRQCTEDTTVVLLMYNRTLCDSTMEQIRQLDLDPARNIQSFTFHGLASALTGTVCHNDTHLTQAIETLGQTPTPWLYGDFSLLLVDEAQDLRPDLLRLVHYLVR